MPTLRSALRLGRRAWLDIGLAQLALIRAQWELKRRPLGTMVRRSGDPLPQPTGPADRALELALAIERAAERGVFRPRCLARSIALKELLARHGIEGSVVRVGVRTENNRLLAHAWVTWGDRVLGDRAEWTSRFTEVNDLRVVRDL